MQTKPFELLSKFNHFKCWESFCWPDGRSSGGRNTRVGGHCGEQVGVRRGRATIAACYPIPAENQIRCGFANSDRTVWGVVPWDSGRHTYISDLREVAWRHLEAS